MKPGAMDSLDAIELVMAIEEAFEGMFGIRNAEVKIFDSPREFVDWLEARPASQPPSKIAQAMLRKLALDSAAARSSGEVGAATATRAVCSDWTRNPSLSL